MPTGAKRPKNNGKSRVHIFAYWKEVKMKFKASLTLSVEAEDEDGAKQAFQTQVGAADFDQSSIEVVEEE